MLFNYKAITKSGEERTGSVDAPTEDVAISSLQKRDLVIVSITTGEKTSIFEMDIGFLTKVSNKEVVILSRQIATLFEANVPALRAFKLLAAESENPLLRRKLSEVADDIQSGMPISDALYKHPDIFSDFYVNMVRSGEESGKLSETFLYLADYLDRSYALTSQIKNALVYPAFVVSIFVLVMIGLFTFIIPKIADILTGSGQELPIYTKVIIGISDFLVNYGLFTLVVAIIAGFGFWKYRRAQAASLSRLALAIPIFGNLFQKLYLARISDNMYTMLTSGISMVRAVEITATVVGSETYRKILEEAAEGIKAGEPMSEALGGHEEIPNMMLQMIRVGEETGELGNILKKIAAFYRREVNTAVETLISLIEPTMIVLLGLGVGVVLAAVLLPIYNLAGGI
ncbi:MAG: type II secretion system F family protein [Patescibacteria group bacterium]|nr:MAG: type II secretion system F family protein [Patescibacteria group bacterium]